MTGLDQDEPPLTSWLVERVSCRRCRSALQLMESAAVPGRVVGEVVRDITKLHIQIAACTAGSHPGASQDLTPSRLDDPPDKDQVQP